MSAPVADPGARMHELAAELFPLPRSLTGNGVRETLRVLRDLVPLELHEVPTGTTVFDWTVPPEWNVREAWICSPDGERIVDYADSNLHVMAYSTPVRARMPLAELRAHLFTKPDQPERVPYRTSFYREGWAFCLAQRQLDSLAEGEYEVCIDSTLEPGHLSYGECLIRGESPDEVLLSAHICHPSLANDNLSGIAVAALLAEWLREQPRRLSYRLIFAPATIGALTWLSRNPEARSRVRHGLTLSCLGDGSAFTYKRTLAGDSAIDRAVAIALRDSGMPHELVDFEPYGYDERQYNAPGFRMAVGALMRGRYGHFPEYHTSADDLTFIRPEHLGESLELLQRVVSVLEGDQTLVNMYPFGEPQLGRRGLYRAIGDGTDPEALQFATLWLLNLSDGAHSLADVAARSGLPFETVARAASLLVEHELLTEPADRAGPISLPSPPDSTER